MKTLSQSPHIKVCFPVLILALALTGLLAGLDASAGIPSGYQGRPSISSLPTSTIRRIRPNEFTQRSSKKSLLDTKTGPTIKKPNKNAQNPILRNQ
jgi:hypothetical protein